MTDQLTDEAVTKLANDCVLAANCMEAEDTFPTGQGILREAARALIDARAERDRLRAESDAFRMCVNCGLIVPASHDRAQPGPGCAAPDACTFDLTPREACDHWRAKAHKYQADAQAAVALVLEQAAQLAEDGLLSVDGGLAAQEIRALALAPADGVAAVEALRKERDSLRQSLDACIPAVEEAAIKRGQAEVERDRLAAANAALEAQVGALRLQLDQKDALYDSGFQAGVKLGWNFGVSGDETGFQAATSSTEHVAELKRIRAALAHNGRGE